MDRESYLKHWLAIPRTQINNKIFKTDYGAILVSIVDSSTYVRDSEVIMLQSGSYVINRKSSIELFFSNEKNIIHFF
jgi:hypothetical protein